MRTTRCCFIGFRDEVKKFRDQHIAIHAGIIPNSWIPDILDLDLKIFDLFRKPTKGYEEIRGGVRTFFERDQWRRFFTRVLHPVEVRCEKTHEVLRISKNRNQRVQLIGQPEIGEVNVEERSGEDATLKKWETHTLELLRIEFHTICESVRLS